MTDQRSVLMEIPEPQAKLTGRLRRSYMDILCSRPAPGVRRRKPARAAERGRALDGGSRRLRRFQKDACQTSVSSELLDSLALAEQSVQMTSSSLTTDLKILLEDLHQKKISVYRSIPYSRLGSNRDAHSYRKAQPHLMAFKRSCQDGGRLLVQRAEWQKVLEFVLAACRYVGGRPAATTRFESNRHRPAARRARHLLHRFKTAARLCLRELEEILREYPSQSKSQIKP
ncbi:hypothetical protein IRJ41_014495 [Triplophysa rosa]|uniref:Uncharacterized protein n=1 Tax=Triplophysa rosa TaxID=992332 RepID=A0A9W7WF05_TRIRA|nr:hypothetical protein IRJ41_014495 [Triplophysa rosa]